jgi:hypothetical protein
MSLLQGRRFQPQEVLQQRLVGEGSIHHLSSLDRQLQALQGSSHGDQSGQTNPYPQRWFRVASGGNVQLPMFEGMQSSNNPLPNMIPGNQLLPSLVASSAVESFLPSSLYSYQPQANDVAPIDSATTPVNFGGIFRYAADDNPFEPVPIAENVSLRHAQSRQEEDK